MKTTKLLMSALLSGSLLGGCIDLSSDDKEALADAFAGFNDQYQEGESEEVNTSEALQKDYIGTEVTDDDALGNASIGGEVSADSVGARALARLAYGRSSSKQQILSRALDAPEASDFTVSYIAGNGEQKTIPIENLNVNFRLNDGDIQFVISGVGDGINYIIEVEVTVDGGDPIELASVSFVPEGATRSEKVEIDPVSTVVAEAVAQKVQNGFFETGGEQFSQDYINDLNETMTAVIEEVIEENPDFALTDFEAAIESEEGVEGLVSQLLAEDDVSDSVNKLEDAAVADTFAPPEVTNDEAGKQVGREVVEELFAALDGDEGGDGGDGGAPQVIIDFFGDKYAEGIEKTIEQIFNSIFAGVEFDENADTTGLSKENALVEFTTSLVDIYDTLDEIIALEDKDELTDAEEMELDQLREAYNDVPEILLGVFPPEDRDLWVQLTGDSNFTVPQAITLVFFTLNDYLAGLSTVERDSETGQLEEKDGVDFDPQFLLGLYGFDPNDAAIAAEYANLQVNWLDVHPGRVWDHDNQQERDVLNLFLCVDAFPEDQFDVSSVSVSFPNKAGTTVTQSLKNDAEFYGDGGDHQSPCWAINPWAESDILSQQEAFRDNQGNVNWDAIWSHLFSSGTVVTDFASGTYSVTVNYSEDGTATTQTFDFNKRIITGLENLTPRFTSPNGLPPFPEPGASPAEWDAFNAAQAAFEITTFPDSASVLFTWNEPELLATTPLPDGVIAVYNLDIGRDVCSENEGCYWEHIFSSWELGSQIFGTQFELPDEIKDLLAPLEITDTPYQANLNIHFIDESTGEFLGNGGWNGAPFRVGEALDLDSTFTLEGTVQNVPDESGQANDNENNPYPIDMYKVAMVKESCMEDITGEAFQHTFTDENGNEVTETFFPWVCSSETLAISDLTEDATTGGYTYSISPTLRDAMGNTNNAWIDVRMFVDVDDDDAIDMGHGEGDIYEPQYWAINNVHFNSWGGVLRINRHDNDGYREEIVIPEQTYEGPSFDPQGQCCGDHGGDGSGGEGEHNEGEGGNGEGGNDNPEIAIMSTDAADILDIALSWEIIDGAIAAADVEEFEVVLVEVDGNGNQVAALVAIFAGTSMNTTIGDMLNGTGGATNATATILADHNTETGENLAELTDATLLENKEYFWFVEAYDANGDSLGSSDDLSLDESSQTPQ